jgi:hypothetical protein
MWLYDCPYSEQTYMHIARNALCVSSMDNNLFLVISLREVGLLVNETTKIHCEDPSVEESSIFDEESGLKISLSLNRIFSAFKTRAPSEKEVEEIENYQIKYSSPLTPMDYVNESCRMNEDYLVDVRGDICRRSCGTKQLLLHIDVLAILDGSDSNDMGTPTNNVNQPDWHKDML